MAKDEAKIEIEALVEKHNTLSTKEIRAYNEANTKQAFILPLFKALGWNIYDTAEVSLEENASAGRVDFAFKINNVARFYVEAKRLGADLNNPDYIKQAITYAYNNGVTWAILTNFTEIRIFNAQRSNAFIALRYDSYLINFDKLWLLSREAQKSDLLDKEAAQYGALPPMAPIEEKLFKQLREWRERIYNELLHYNEWLKPDQRDEVIEKLFNRLIFVRTAEDRNLEEHKLRAAVNQWENTRNKKGQLTTSVHEIFTYYNGYYDSDLFKQHLLDDDRLWVDEHTLKDVINGLYDIPGGIASYDFSLIDADVLGRVYEQYLGYVSKHVIAKAEAKKATENLGFNQDADYKLIERKKRRKEQGIYYTPKFVTDYIVKETIGRFIKEHNHNEIMNMKILDPACGSGSFLIRAYDELLKYYADQKGKPAAQLDQFERLPVLTQNIFGVDLDQQAVEIARLNLLLRALAKREILPPLTENIKRGNSLISGTDEELQEYFGDNWRDKHPFNWEYEFKDIMADGGFDVVIGNPPYGIVYDNALKVYFEDKFHSFKRNNDIFVSFIQKGLQLLANNGFFAFIIPNTFQGGSYFDDIKRYILEQASIIQMLDFGSSKVFSEANVFNTIIILQKQSCANIRNDNKVKFVNALAPDITNPSNIRTEERIQTELADLWWKSKSPLTNRLLKTELNLGKICFIKDVGLNYWTIGRGKSRGGSIADKILYEGDKQNIADLPFLKGRDVNKYYKTQPSHWLRHNYKIFLDPSREIFRFSPEFLLNGPKIIYRQTADSIIATIDDDNYLVDKTLHVILVRDDYKNKYCINYILGILNSKLALYIYQDLAQEGGRLFAQVKTFIMKKLPVIPIDIHSPADNDLRDRLVTLVDKMLKLNKKLMPIEEDASDERDCLVKEIEKTDKEIDSLVYDLYGLTEEERLMVEGSKSE